MPLILPLEIRRSIYHQILPHRAILHARILLDTRAHRTPDQNHQTCLFLFSKKIHAEARIHLYASTEFTLMSPIHTSQLLLQCLEPTGLASLIRRLRIMQWIDPRLQSGWRFFSGVLASPNQGLGFDVRRRMDSLKEIWMVLAGSEMWLLERRYGMKMTARGSACRERRREGAVVAIKRTANEFVGELAELVRSVMLGFRWLFCMR